MVILAISIIWSADSVLKPSGDHVIVCYKHVVFYFIFSFQDLQPLKGHFAYHKTCLWWTQKPYYIWSKVVDSNKKIVIDYLMHILETINLSKWWLCNTTYELEPGALFFLPKLIPVGPLLSSHENKIRDQLDNFGKKISLL